MNYVGMAGAAATLFALLVRVLLRDRVPYLSAVHYGAPPILIAAGALACAAAWALARRRRLALAALTAACLCGAWQAGVSRSSRPPAPGELRLLLWNVQHGLAGWDRVAAEIAARDADVVALVEADDGARSAPPGWTWRWIDHGLALGVKGRIHSAEIVPLGDSSRAAVARFEVRGRPLTAILVDIGADPLRPRGLAFRPLDELRRRVKPDLVLGDFNTPRDTAHFDAWRGELTHAFEAAGAGWDLTWPATFPLLSIDHVWCAPTLVPTSCVHLAGLSDHRSVNVGIGFKR
ncbi:MAG TPA: endonuclease/exonuclease/phosphatase family protein [Planctomycetota bacterium]